jgi:hypothetical protein
LTSTSNDHVPMPASGVSSQVSRHPSLIQEAIEVHFVTGSRPVADLEGEIDASQWSSRANQNNFDP